MGPYPAIGGARAHTLDQPSAGEGRRGGELSTRGAARRGPSDRARDHEIYQEVEKSAGEPPIFILEIYSFCVEHILISTG